MKWSIYNIYVPDLHSDKVVIFNTLTRSILKLGLGSGFKGEISPEEILKPDQILQVKKQGIICDDDIDEAEVFKYTMAKNRYSTASLGFWLSLTSACNFTCSYCFESTKNSGHGAKFLSEADWKKILLFVRNKIKKEGLRNLNVVFFGGEPLLNYSVLLNAAKDLKELSGLLNVSTLLITNASLLNEQRCSELAEYISAVQISIDGLPEEHDKLRPYSDGRGSFHDIVRNTHFAVAKFKEVSISIGVDKSNSEKIPPFIDYLAANIKNKANVCVGFRLINPTQTDVQYCPSIIEGNVKQLASFRRQAVSSGFFVGKDFISGPCMYSSPNGLVFDESLNVYPCPAYLYLNPVAALDQNGVLNGFRPEWYGSVLRNPGCAVGCKYGPICFGGCKFMGKDGASTCPKKINESMLQERIQIYLESLESFKSRK